MYTTYYAQTSGFKEEDAINAFFRNKEYTPEEKQFTRHTVKGSHLAIPPATNETWMRQIESLAQMASDLELLVTEDHYHRFYIPKHSGGFREINAPDEIMKDYLQRVNHFLQVYMRMLPHSAAYAYVKNESVVTMMKRHQKNRSKWFLKLDIKDFFPSWNEESIFRVLGQIYPIGEYIYSADMKRVLRTCTLNHTLPQGSPTSPYLTNILMVPFDYEFSKYLQEEQEPFFVYTRYADDMIISSRKSFKFDPIVNKAEELLSNLNENLKLNRSKIRYGSTAGRNWNCGIMLNKDNRMTLGHKENQKFKSLIFRFFSENIEEKTWHDEDVMQMQGQVSWHKAVDPDYTEYVLNKYSSKFNISYKELIKRFY